jgi:hypothetical protein
MMIYSAEVSDIPFTHGLLHKMSVKVMSPCLLNNPIKLYLKRAPNATGSEMITYKPLIMNPSV